MAELIDFGGEANSNLVAGLGTNEAVFTMPGNRGLKVQSVLATIDNTAGGATTAKVTVRDSSGQVIATETQGDTIPAADTGTATFALRAGLNGGAGIRFNRENVGGFLHVTTTAETKFTAGDYFQVDATSLLFLTSLATMLVNVGTNFNLTVVDEFTADTGATTINGGTGITLNSSAGFVEAFAPNAGFHITDTEWQLLLANGTPFTVYDHNNAPIFRVDEDGDLHGKTGKSLTFDL